MQIAILISQIRTNSISIVRMKSFDAPGSPDKDESLSSVVPFTCNMEQVSSSASISPCFIFSFDLNSKSLYLVLPHCGF